MADEDIKPVEYRKDLPLMMGNKLIGRIHFDKETGDITGRLMDTEMIDLLNEFFGDNLLEISFFGKSAIDSSDFVREGHEKLREFINRKDTDV